MDTIHVETPSPRVPQATTRRSVYLDTLGCAKNLVDSEATLGLLSRSGYDAVESPRDADVLIVNTCGFLAASREESIERILELAQLKGFGRPRVLAVLGCLVSRAPVELAESIPEVDLWLPAGDHGFLPQALDSHLRGLRPPSVSRATDRSGSGRAPIGAFAGFADRVLLGPRHTAYLKISEGCTNTCSFCSIPLMRGTQRSRSLESIVHEAEALASGGVRELHLVAQDLTHYGFDLPVRRDLLDLVGRLSDVDGIEWIRLLYAHPAHLSSRLLEGLFAVPKVVRYLDMPIQHASASILRRMNRPYGPDRVRRQVERLRGLVPGITLRTTVIVGFPGETERDFLELCRFLAELRYDRLGVFTYSREPGTASYDLPQRPRATTTSRRLQALTELQMHVAAEKAAARVGDRVRVLVDALLDPGDPSRDGLGRGAGAQGRSEGEALDIDGCIYLETRDTRERTLRPGRFVEARIREADVYDWRARVLSTSS